jgi:hydrogenase 3 maturation protease
MTSWQERLTVAFSNAATVTIIGIGNDLKADDGIGPYVIEELQNRTPSHIELINASTVPENFLSHLIESNPHLILLIDAALMQTKPGTIKLIDKESIGGVAFSSHQLPLTFFLEYLENNINTTILILGIQPLTDEFAQPISNPVQQAANEIISTLSQLFAKTL